MMIFTAYLVRGLQLVLGMSKRAMTERVEELGARDEGIPTPIQSSFNILAYFTALQLPAQWRRFLHPILVSSLIAVLGVWIFALIRGNSLDNALHAYKTGTEYTQLWQGQKGLLNLGVGDLFSSVLDVSIVALALSMFQYRHELRRHVCSHFLNTSPLLFSWITASDHLHLSYRNSCS